MATLNERLPIDEAIPEIVAKLRTSPSLVLVAPPGAGKTTRVPPALVDAGIVGARQRVLMLEPRRIAARSAARRIARERGGEVGGEVGYQVRFEDRTSRATRIAILTEGLLTRKLQADPTLEGVGAVVLDEFHERSIHADLALAFLKEVQETVRPELKIVVMSATLDADRIAAFLGGCPIVASEGRMFPVERQWIEHPDERPLPDQIASAVRRSIREGDGDVLVFLPGAPEIERTASLLAPVVGETADVRVLYGALDAREQDLAIERGPRRKIVLATNIAETSLTIEGVSAVIDSGLEKIVRHDPARGIDRLDVARISKASADQRAGRAGRLGPGCVLRLWTESEDRRLAPESEPEIARIDLAPVVLEVISWSGKDPHAFGWFEAPPGPALDRALALLTRLGAIESRGRGPRGTQAIRRSGAEPADVSAGEARPLGLTELGKKLRAFPLHPRLGAVLVEAHRLGVVREGALLAALASERDIVRRGRSGEGAVTRDHAGPSDLLVRADLFHQRAREIDPGAARSVADVRDRLVAMVERTLGPTGAARPRDEEQALLRVLLAGFADRVAKRRAPGSDRVRIAGGRGGRISPDSVVKDAPLLIAIEIDDSGQAADSLIRLASAVDESWLSGIETVHVVRWNDSREAAEAVIERRYEDLLLAESIDPEGDPEAIASRLAEEAASRPERALSRTPEVESLLNRIAFLRAQMPELELPAIDLPALLPALAYGLRTFADLRKADLAGAIRDDLGRGKMGALDRHAPERLAIGRGKKPPRLRYEPGGPPVLSIKLQDLFGVRTTPRVAQGRVAVKVELLAPNQRPVQITQDLESFWTNTYPEVRKQLRARYPKHEWPEKP